MERLVRNYMITSNDTTEEAKPVVSEIVNSIKSGQATLITLVQVLGEFLTNEDHTIRAKGTGLLSTVLADCPQEQVNNAAINVLVDFYCERLSDTACVPELLQGIESLTYFNSFNNENSIKVAKSIFASVNVQSFQQTARHYVFEIFDRLLKHHLALKQMGQDFVIGFIQAMDGEKDPRNLLLAFSLVKLIIHEFDISERVELLFEVTFCYFPITFKPPPDDPYGITADDLKISLRECLSATPYFAELAMPLLLEKLTSTSGNAKKDSMETLAACAPVYGAKSLLPHLEDLWEYLRDEVVNATDDSFENIALEAIKSIVSTLSSGIINKMDHLQQFLKTVITECMENLKEPELKLAKPCGKILMYCAMASDPSFNIVMLATLRTLIQQHKESELATRKKGILEVLRVFITASKNLYGSIEKPLQDLDADFVTPLSTFKDVYMEIFSSALLSQNEYNELRLCGLLGLHDMVLLHQFFNDDEIGIVLQYFNRAVLEEIDQEISNEALKSLANIAKYKSNIVLEVTLPVFLDSLPCDKDEMDIDSIRGMIVKKANYVKTLDALSELAIEPILFEAYVPQILKKLDFASSAEIELEYSVSLLQSLHSLLLKKTNHPDISRYVDIIVPHLLTKSIGPSLYSKPEVNDTIQSVFFDKKVIKIVAGIISVITKNLNVSEQSTFISQMFEIFVKGNLNLNYLTFPDQEKALFTTAFNPLSVESSIQQQNLTLLFTAAVGSCRKEVPYPLPNISEFLSNLVEISLNTKNELQHHSLSQLVASILNKWNQENELNQFVETKILGELRNHFALSSTGNEVIKKTSLDIYIWLTKALILRAHLLGYRCVDQITSQFNDPVLGKRASEGFEVLIGESDLLNKQSFAVMKALYKQRFFNYCMPILAEGFKSSSNEVKHNYLIALSHLLRNIPKQVLLSELPSLIPLLIHSLSSTDADLKSSTIDTFYIISADAPHIISEHVSSLIPLLLSSTKVDKGNTMRVRISALQCLGILPDHVPFDVLFPFKPKILKELSEALDDKKRLVRKQAVDCRSKWFLFIGPRAD